MPIAPLLDAPTRIGGGWQSGDDGYLSITFNDPPVPDTGSSLPFPPTATYDVVKWYHQTTIEQGDIPGSGGLGATTKVTIGYEYHWTCDIVYDLTRVMELALRSIAGADIFFRLGDPNKTGLVTPPPIRLLWCPQAKIEQVGTANEAGDGKKVRQRISGTASGHTLLLPEYGNLNDNQTLAGAYLQYITENPYG